MPVGTENLGGGGAWGGGVIYCFLPSVYCIKHEDVSCCHTALTHECFTYGLNTICAFEGYRSF